MTSAEDYQHCSYVHLLRETVVLFTTHLPAAMSSTGQGPESSSENGSLVLNSSKLLLYHNQNYLTELGLALSGAVLVTILRLLLTRFLVKGALSRLELISPKHAMRFTESFWNFLFYSISFTMAAQIVRHNEYLEHPERLWLGFSLSSSVPTVISSLYLMEVSYYFHSLYAVFALNEWKHDSYVLFAHHIIALFLIIFSYLTRTFRVGVLVMFLHDICDVIMEGGKSLNYLRHQFPSSWAQTAFDSIRIVCFGLFILTWFVFRLYYYPVVVIDSALRFLIAHLTSEAMPFLLLLYILLWLIFTMNLYWGTLIIKVIIKFIRGGHEEIEDIRELDDEVNSNGKNHSQSKSNKKINDNNNKTKSQ